MIHHRWNITCFFSESTLRAQKYWKKAFLKMPSEFQGGCKKYPLNISFLVSFLLPPPNFFKTIFLDQHFSGTISRNTFFTPHHVGMAFPEHFGFWGVLSILLRFAPGRRVSRNFVLDCRDVRGNAPRNTMNLMNTGQCTQHVNVALRSVPGQ